MNSLSHKKVQGIIAAVIIAIIAIGGAYWYKQAEQATVYTTSETQSASQNLAPVQILTQSVSDLDTDGDGLKDWEEVLWGSNPRVADSDGDGMNDGDEVKAGRNPAISGRDDLAVAPIGTQPATNVEDELYTDRFSKEIFARYAAYKKSNGGVDAQEERELIAEMLKGVETLEKTATVYDISDLIVVPDTDENYRKYRNIFISVTSQYQENITNNELLILEKSLRNNDQSRLAEIDDIVSRYGLLIQEMRALPIPQGLAEDHINLINSYSRLQALISSFKEVFSDPIIVMSNLTQYYQESTVFAQIAQTILVKTAARGAAF